MPADDERAPVYGWSKTLREDGSFDVPPYLREGLHRLLREGGTLDAEGWHPPTEERAVLALAPDDILILTVPRCLSVEELERMKLAVRLPNRVIVLDDGVKLEVLRPTLEIYDGLPPLEAKGRFIGYAADGSAWVLAPIAVLGQMPGVEWGAAGFEEDSAYGIRPVVKLLTADLADFIVVSVPAMMPKRPREASHGEATDQAPAAAVGPEQRDAPVSGRGDGAGETADQAQDDEGAGGARARGGGAGPEAEAALKNE